MEVTAHQEVAQHAYVEPLQITLVFHHIVHKRTGTNLAAIVLLNTKVEVMLMLKTIIQMDLMILDFIKLTNKIGLHAVEDLLLAIQQQT